MSFRKDQLKICHNHGCKLKPVWQYLEILCCNFPLQSKALSTALRLQRYYSYFSKLSGTGSEGATIRVYIEKYVGPEAGAEALGKEAKEVLAPLVDVAYILSNIVKLTGRKEPTVIT